LSSKLDLEMNLVKIDVDQLDADKITPINYKQNLRRIVAIGVILFLSNFGVNNFYIQHLPTTEGYLVKSPEEAYEITREALSLISRKMNKAKGSVKDSIRPLSITSIIKK